MGYCCFAVPFRLKDDDSGDHDQNEENSTQKDGEKEKTERDKSQSGSKRKVSSVLHRCRCLWIWDLVIL